ncbi:hypothetical protein ACE01N_19630 [Saccharicrinis sp. FJH2]|uniref:hypothetical protein n=1 Tax=Saccharicrinis sp. FJH65 TaxID=3344659 RepID=UPI0035F2CF41
MTFNERLKELITNLETENLKQKEQTLNGVLEILKTIETIKDLKREKSLINRIVIDSFIDQQIGEKILQFTENYTK